MKSSVLRLYKIAGLFFVLVILDAKVHAQCLGHPGFSFAPQSYGYYSAYAQPSMAVAGYYRPQAYYMTGSYMQIAQTPMFGSSVCAPMMYNPTFQHNFMPPMQSPFEAALPHLIGGVGELATNLMGSSSSNQERPSYRDYTAQRQIDEALARPRSLESHTSPSLETDGVLREIPRSNSAGASGFIPLPLADSPSTSGDSGSLVIPSTTEPPSPPVAITDTDDTVTRPVARPVDPDLGLGIGTGSQVGVIDIGDSGREDISDARLDEFAAEEPSRLAPPSSPDTPPVLVVNEENESPSITAPQELDHAPIIAGPLEEDDIGRIPPLPLPDPRQQQQDTLIDVVDNLTNTLVQVPHLGDAPLDPCRILTHGLEPNAHPLVQGALRMMAVFYQSCDVLEVVLDDQTPLPPAIVNVSEQSNKLNQRSLSAQDIPSYISSHPYLSLLQSQKDQGLYPGENCRDVLEMPPIFSLGAKPEIRTTGQTTRVNLFVNQTDRCSTSNIACDSAPVTALDCSGFAQAALTAAGLRIYKDQKDRREIGTSGFLEAALDPNSCLTGAMFERQGDQVETLKAGDLVVAHDHHMYMIRHAGPDPLGVNRALARNNCDSIQIDHFDFEIIQSGAGRSLGVTQMNSQYPAQSQVLLNRLLFEAQKTCREVLENRTLSPALVQTSRRTEFMVIRHSGMDDPACRHQPERVQIEGEECLENCAPIGVRQ